MDFEKLGIKIEENVSRPGSDMEVASALLDRLNVGDCAVIPQPGQYKLLIAIKSEAKRTGCVVQIETAQRELFGDGNARVWLLAKGKSATRPGDVREFIMGECVAADGLRISKTLLYRAFCQWAEREGKAPMSSIMFSFLK